LEKSPAKIPGFFEHPMKRINQNDVASAGSSSVRTGSDGCARSR
jgi:hypothetical protein